jgi:hypothetical protein
MLPATVAPRVRPRGIGNSAAVFRSRQKRAKALARREAVQNALLGFAPTRASIRRFVLPKPGQGPSKAARDAGYYDKPAMAGVLGLGHGRQRPRLRFDSR